MKLRPWVQNALFGIALIAAIIGCADYAIDENFGINFGRQVICLVVEAVCGITLMKWGRMD